MNMQTSKLIIMISILSCVFTTACDKHVIKTEIAEPELYFVRGYRSEDDLCKLTGETEFTNQFLDDAADLVTCPRGKGNEFVQSNRAVLVYQTTRYSLFSVPRR